MVGHLLPPNLLVLSQFLIFYLINVWRLSFISFFIYMYGNSLHSLIQSRPII